MTRHPARLALCLLLASLAAHAQLPDDDRAFLVVTGMRITSEQGVEQRDLEVARGATVKVTARGGSSQQRSTAPFAKQGRQYFTADFPVILEATYDIEMTFSSGAVVRIEDYRLPRDWRTHFLFHSTRGTKSASSILRRQKDPATGLECFVYAVWPFANYTALGGTQLAAPGPPLQVPPAGSSAGPVRVHPVNPHYFSYQGKPLLLLTSDHTYFAVTAADFDFARYLDTLASYRNNFTRIYPGAHPVNYPNQPRLFPWKRLPSGKYDLNTWDPDYFARLHAFMQHAASKDIIVDIVPFNGFGSEARKSYQWRWEWSPLNAANNIQGAGVKREHFCTLDEPATTAHQLAYLRKLAVELNRYDNLIYDLSDEPDLFNTLDDAKVNAWVSTMMDELIATEAKLPKKHLIAQSYYRSLEDHGKQWGADPRTSWISVEYTGGLEAFDRQYAYGKPYVLIETVSPVLNPLGFWKIAYGPDSSRIHSWAFLAAGGAGFMEFNDDFDSQAPQGREETHVILRQRKLLRDFMESFDFVRMSHFSGFSGASAATPRDRTAAAAKPWATAIAEPGRQYALYASHSYIRNVPNGPGFYEAVPGDYQETITLKNVPAGRYRAEWVQPADFSSPASATLEHPGGDLLLTPPRYAIDIALRLKLLSR